MPTPLYLVDAFASTPFTGNPAGVCLPDSPLAVERMQSIALEMNQAETAFLSLRDDGDWNLRWFTPTVEVDLCGHATLASAYMLWRTKRVADNRVIRFHTRSGVLVCSHRGGKIEMDFPAEAAALSNDDVETALEIKSKPVFVGRNRMDVLVVLNSADEVRAIQPDAARINAIDARGIIVTARSDRPEFDFISRFFAPQSGILEDPVTGSAHCCLAPYWSGVLGKTEMTGFQASRRGGAVSVRCAGDRVHLGGQAILVVSGELVTS